MVVILSCFRTPIEVGRMQEDRILIALDYQALIRSEPLTKMDTNLTLESVYRLNRNVTRN